VFETGDNLIFRTATRNIAYLCPVVFAVAATPPPVDWTNLVKLLYSARNEYGLQDMSPASWDDLLNRSASFIM